MRTLTLRRCVLPVVLLALTAACGPATTTPPTTSGQPAAKPASPAAPAQAAPQQPAKPAAPAPAAPQQPAKPVAAAPTAPQATAKPAVPAPSGEPKRLFVASSNTTSTYYTYHVAEAKYLNAKVPDITLTVMETGGGADNLARYAKGETAFGLMSAGTAYEAYRGVGSFTGKQLPDLRFLWIYSAGARVAFAREDPGVAKLADLSGKDFNPGLKGSSTEKDFKAHADILGIKPRYYAGSLDDAVQAIKDRRIVGMVKSQAGITVDASTLDLMVATKIRVLGYGDEQIKEIKEQRPWDLFVSVKDDEWSKGFPAFRTLATIVGSGTTRQNLSEDVAYKLIKAITEPAAVQEVSGAVGFMKGWDYRKKTLELAPLPLHVGALKYFREVGDKVPEHLIPPEAK